MPDERVLVVDHMRERREHLVSLLTDQNIGAIQASSCEEGLRLLLKDPFNLVLSETELPKKSGLYLLQEVKKRYPDIEVVLLTHNASSFTLLQALRHGAYDFIVRPIDTGEILVNTLKRAFTHHRQKLEKEALLNELEAKNYQLNQTLHRMQALNEAIRGLASANEIQSIFSKMLYAVIEEVKADTGFVALFDRSGERLGLKIAHGISNTVSHAYAKEMPTGLSLVMARRSKPILVADEMPEGLNALISAEERGHLLSPAGLLSVPLRIKGRLAGVMIVSGHPVQIPFAEHDLLFMTQLGIHAQLQLEKIGLIHQLQRDKKQKATPLMIQPVEAQRKGTF